MDTKLKAFCTVAETKSFTKAAGIVHLSQPAVSLQIQSLEEFFETKLFDKTGKKVSLTPAGKILYEHATHIMGHYNDVVKEINKLTGTMKGAVEIGASTTLGNYILPQIITDFKRAHPKIKLKLRIGNTERIEDLMHSGFVDFGIVEGLTSRSNTKTEKVISDKLTLIVHPKHPLAGKRTVSVLELTREPFILREQGSGTRQHIEEFLNQHGLNVSDLHISLIMGSTESIKAAVEAGNGIAILSPWAVRKEVEDGRLKSIKLREGDIPRDLTLIYPKKHRLTHADKELILFIKNYPYENF
ncbi:MAG TPA: LysR family transcriptional regulator [Nitrospirae bacterium]|nr:LysR family transcriptional regulator [Nitrospirota bacterium]